MARRNVWTYQETKELLTVIKELDLMKSFGEERNSKLYNIAQDELRQRGFHDKDSFQIEHKWKNLKRTYYKTKRENYLTESCEFFEELDELMAMKPTLPPAKLTGKARPKQPKAVLECFDLFLTKMAKVDRENNDDFFKKQKDLVDYEFELYAQDERQYTCKLSQMLNKNMDDFCTKAQDILLQEGLIENLAEMEEAEEVKEPVPTRHNIKKEVVKEFYQTWRE